MFGGIALTIIGTLQGYGSHTEERQCQPGGPGLLLFRHSEALHAGEPTCYDDKYADMMHMCRYAADTATSIEDAAGIPFSHPRAVAKSWRVAERLAAAIWSYRARHPDPRPLIATMTRRFEDLTKRLDEGYRKDKEAASECCMAYMLVQDGVLTHGEYELPEPARHLIVAYSDIATPPWTAEPPAPRHARWYMRQEHARGGSSAYHMRGMQRHLTTRRRGHHVTTHPPDDGNGAAGVGGVVDQRT
jgi:hypothetical protein